MTEYQLESIQLPMLQIKCIQLPALRMTTLIAVVVLIIPGLYNAMIRGRVELLRAYVRKHQSSPIQ